MGILKIFNSSLHHIKTSSTTPEIRQYPNSEPLFSEKYILFNINVAIVTSQAAATSLSNHSKFDGFFSSVRWFQQVSSFYNKQNC